jgi:hypothetical protein
LKFSAHVLVKRASLQVRGTLTIRKFRDDPAPQKLVFQGTTPLAANCYDALGKPMMMRRHVIPFDPRSLKQQAQRQRLRAATLSWHTLSPGEKAAANERAKARQITGFNQWVSEYILAHPLQSASEWDSGASTWDSGTTIWPMPEGAFWDGGSSIWDSGTTVWDT